MRSLTACALLAVAALAPRAAAETVDSPIYKSWAACQPGTTITHVEVTEGPGPKLTTTTTYELRKVADDKVELRKAVASDATGTLVAQRPETIQVKRKFFLFPGVKKEDIGKPQNALAQGEEMVTVAGREFRANWYDTKGRTEVGETLTRTWMSDDVPQTLLKSVTRIPASGLTMSLELTEFKRP